MEIVNDKILKATINACTVVRDIEILKLLKQMDLLTDEEYNAIIMDVNNYYGRPLIL